MEEVGVDLLSANGGAQGEVANKFINNGLSIAKMRPFEYKGQSYISVNTGKDPKTGLDIFKSIPIQANATLRRDEWKALDDVLLEVGRQRLGGIEDLISKGLTYNLGNAMGTTMLEWHDVSDFGSADVTMDGVNRHKNDTPNFQHNYLPIPIIHSNYEINARFLEASRNTGNPLDTLGAERAGRRVKETLESMLFTDTTYSFGEKDARGNNTIYSYINHPDRNLLALGTPWDQLTTNIGKTIVDKVHAAKQVSLNALHRGPWMLYIPSAYETVIDKDYDADTTASITIRERIMKIANIQGIKVVDYLPANNVLLVQMTSDVVRLVRGLPLQNVQWSTEGNLLYNYRVMTIQVPQIRSDQNRKSGVVHLS